MANTKQTALVRASIILLLLVALVGGYFAANFAKPKYDIRHFAGRAVEFKDSSVVMRGVYVSDAVLPKTLLIQRDVEFRVTSSTAFQKIATVLPPEDEVRKNGGTFRLDQLASTTQASSFDEMRGLTEDSPYFAIDVESSGNMYGEEAPFAAKITYRPTIFSGRIEPPKSQ